jgi:hypothetical protein
MNPQIQFRKSIALSLIVLLLAYFALPQRAQAVSPAPDGGYPGFTTAEGQNALKNLTTGQGNTALGWFSLFSATTGSFNTGVGAGALALNTGESNTATGAVALFLNTTGSQNTATGAAALLSNTTGSSNTAVGDHALSANTTGAANTANGALALSSNTTGQQNAANGADALLFNTTGVENTAIGTGALSNNTVGNNNVALGFTAGSQQTTGSNNVYIGVGTPGVAGESNACYIASIFGQTLDFGIPVLINGSGKLGAMTSSKRFKEEIKSMDKASEALLALKPVTFRYKKEIDPAGTSQFGLVAEDVEKVNPDLVVRDKEGKPYSVRYEQVNAMLLNEFLKEHRRVEQLEKQIERLTAGLQKVSAQLEASKPARQVVNNP